MAFVSQTSRQRFRAYLECVRLRRYSDTPPEGDTPSRSGPRQRSFWQLFLQFWGLLVGHRGTIFVALATLSVGTLLKLIPPAATKLTIDHILLHKPLVGAPAWFRLPASSTDQLLLIGGSVLVLSVVESALQLCARWFATRATKRVQVSVRRRVFAHAVHLPLERVYQLKSGGVASILREDAGGVAELVFSMLFNPWRAIIQLLGSLIVLAWVDWRLLLGSLVLLPLIFLSHRTWISRIRPLHRDVRKQRQDIDSQATEAFGGMRVVRAFAREHSEMGRFVLGNHLMARQEVHAWWWMRSVELVWDIIVPLASAALLLYGGSQVLAGRLSLGDLMMFMIYLTMLLGPLSVLVETATALQTQLAGLDRVLDLMGEQLEMPSDEESIRLDERDVAGRVSLEDVGFRYPRSSEHVLNTLNLTAEPGQVIALVGPSGAGKTTLCNLIARFYDPSEGRITLDGVDLRSIDVASYRRLIGIVEQDVFLFDGTIAQNIAYARRSATQEQIEHAARVANAHDFVAAMPKGYETIIGERGVRLSGGQRQRLAIARAVLADPRILILDEATSNLDTESERLIQQSLYALMRGRTSFVIAHRLSTIRHADLIVVLEGGHIVETGTHEELMATGGGHYHRMVLLQTGQADLLPEVTA